MTPEEIRWQRWRLKDTQIKTPEQAQQWIDELEAEYCALSWDQKLDWKGHCLIAHWECIRDLLLAGVTWDDD